MTHIRTQAQQDETKATQARSGSTEAHQVNASDLLGQRSRYSATQSNLLRLQQTIGNRAVLRRMAVQREVAPQDMPQTDYTITPEILAAIPIEEVTSALGDYPTPDPNTVMAKRADVPFAVVQRDGTGASPAGNSGSATPDDDNRRRLGIDPQAGYTFPIYTPRGANAPVPWSFQVTGLYRNFNIHQLGSDALGLDIGHEPGASLAIDSSGAISAQAAMTLLNFHWMPPWNRQLEVGLSGIVNTTLLPSLAVSLGGQVQAEQHIVPWFSITFGVNGMWTPPTSAAPGQFAVTGNTSALFHFNLF